MMSKRVGNEMQWSEEKVVLYGKSQFSPPCLEETSVLDDEKRLKRDQRDVGEIDALYEG